MNIVIERFSDCYETSEVDPEDEWSRASTQTDWTIGRAYLTNKSAYEAEPCSEGIEVGDTIYAVIVIYSSGDTFGHDGGSSLEVVSIHKNKELADKNLNAIKNPVKSNRKSYEDNLIIELDNGGKINRYCPWDGYFESLDSAEVVEFIVEKE